MKAIVTKKYGTPDILEELNEVNKPLQDHDEVLVSVKTASINYGNLVLSTI